MERPYDYLLIFLVGIALITHLMKIIFLIFNPKWMLKYKTFSNTNLNKYQLFLYYTITIFFLLGIVYKKFL